MFCLEDVPMSKKLSPSPVCGLQEMSIIGRPDHHSSLNLTSDMYKLMPFRCQCPEIQNTNTSKRRYPQNTKKIKYRMEDVHWQKLYPHGKKTGSDWLLGPFLAYPSFEHHCAGTLSHCVGTLSHCAGTLSRFRSLAEL